MVPLFQSDLGNQRVEGDVRPFGQARDASEHDRARKLFAFAVVDEPNESIQHSSMPTGMNALADKGEPLAIDVSFTNNALCVVLSDGGEVSAPVQWFPRLLNATAEQRSKWEVIGG